MTVGPLVLMARLKGAHGRHVRVTSGEAIELSGLGLEVFGASVTARGLGHVVLFRRDPQGRAPLDSQVQLEQPDQRGDTLPFFVKAPGGVLEAVLFRVGEARTRLLPSPPILKAIEAIRADDTDATRQVLCDVLEDVGAVAEAEDVRLELELHGFEPELAQEAIALAKEGSTGSVQHRRSRPQKQVVA